eukprot:1294349-Prymnesium_polylepis.1
MRSGRQPRRAQRCWRRSSLQHRRLTIEATGVQIAAQATRAVPRPGRAAVPPPCAYPAHARDNPAACTLLGG